MKILNYRDTNLISLEKTKIKIYPNDRDQNFIRKRNYSMKLDRIKSIIKPCQFFNLLLLTT